MIEAKAQDAQPWDVAPGVVPLRLVGRKPKCFFGLLKSFIGTSLMGFPTKPEQVHLLLKSNPAFARVCGFSHKKKDREEYHYQQVCLRSPGRDGQFLGHPPPRKQSHHAHSSQKTVTVKYPHHPLYGQTLEVIGHRTQNNESCLIVLVPGARRQFLPVWMTEEDAASCSTVASPVLLTSALLRLCAFLEPLILSYSDPEGTTDTGDFDGSNNPSATTPTPWVVDTKRFTSRTNSG
ncbi:MAG: hypothetical protein GY703_10665 [Gammaproteobacteria bacterium]|nr:hypothetical protein [Gammaproteobacteria bacterium]